MAKATIETKQIEVTKIEERKVIKLELSGREAQAVTIVLGKVGGTNNGTRGYCQRVFSALVGLGFKYGTEHNPGVNGDIVFPDDQLPIIKDLPE